MNICFVCGGFKGGGIGRAVSTLVNSLETGQEITPFIITYQKSNGTEQYKIEDTITRDYLTPKYQSMLQCLLHGGIFKLKQKLIKYKIDIVIACGVLYFPLVTIAAKLAGVKSICWEHTSPETASDLRFQKAIRIIGSKTSTANVLISKDGLNYYNKYLCKNKNYLIYNSVDYKQEQFEKPYNNESKKIISVGRLTDAKDFTRLIRIAEHIFKIHPDWCWDIYGDGELRDVLENQIKALNLVGKVVLKGNVNNIYEIYNQYSFLVMTSKFEGFPMALIEGAAAGLPLIGFDIKTGPNEIIVNGHNGFICNKDSDDDMILAIRTLMDKPALRKKFSDNAKLTSFDYKVSRISSQWKELFTKI